MSEQDAPIQEISQACSPRRHRRWTYGLIAGFVLGSLAGITLLVLFEPQHEATAMIQARAVKTPLIVDPDRSPLDRPVYYENFVQTQMALIRSTNVLTRVLENPTVARLEIVQQQGANKREWLERKLHVKNIQNSEIIAVSIRTDSEEASEKIVDAVIDAYFNFLEEHARRMNNDLVGSLRVEERRQRQLATALQESIHRKTREAALVEVATQTAVSMSTGMTSGIVPIESWIQEIQHAEVKLMTQLAQRKDIVERMENPGSIPISLLIQLNPELKFLNEQRNALVQQRMLAETFSTPDDPQIVPMDRQIELIDERVRTIASSADISTVEAAMHHFRFQDEAALFQLDQDIRTQKILVAALANKYQQQRIRSIDRAAVPDIALEIAQLERANRTLSLIEERIQTVTTEMRAPSQITPLSSAILSITPSLETVAMIVGTGFIVFFFLPLLCVLCYHCCCRRN